MAPVGADDLDDGFQLEDQLSEEDIHDVVEGLTKKKKKRKRKSETAKAVKVCSRGLWVNQKSLN